MTRSRNVSMMVGRAGAERRLATGEAARRAVLATIERVGRGALTGCAA
jgi:hypothetical protein